MKTISRCSVICVLTARGPDRLLEEGGSQAWVLDHNRAKACKYVLCVQNNRGAGNEWGTPTKAHHSAFLVGKLKDVVRADSAEDGYEDRWLLTFSEYAEIDVPGAWPGNRNPVLYSDLENFNIDPASLVFKPMPERQPRTSKPPSIRTLSIAEAKEALSQTFGVSPSAIEITVRG